jgi:hypothetical protein
MLGSGVNRDDFLQTVVVEDWWKKESVFHQLAINLFGKTMMFEINTGLIEN